MAKKSDDIETLEFLVMVVALVGAGLYKGGEWLYRKIPKMIERINDSNFKEKIVAPFNQESLEKTFEDLSSLTINTLITELESDDWKRRARAANLLGRTQDLACVEPLIITLKDEQKKVGAQAAISLGNIKDPRAVPFLVELLEPDRGKLTLAAIEALSKIGDSASVQPLIALLDREKAETREEAALALGAIGDERAAHKLTFLILNDKSRAVRNASVEALRRIGAGSAESDI